MIADIFWILSIILGIIFLTEGLLPCILTIVGGSLFSYVLYGIATILRNTEKILDKLNGLPSEKDGNADEN